MRPSLEAKMLARLFLAAFLLAHAGIHAGFLSPAPAATAVGPPWPFSLHDSWRHIRPYLAAVVGILVLEVATVVRLIGAIATFIGFGAVLLLAEATHAADHRVFPGRLVKSELALTEKLIVAAARAPEGDYRPWDNITEWAQGIPRLLKRVAPQAPSPAAPSPQVPLPMA